MFPLFRRDSKRRCLSRFASGAGDHSLESRTLLSGASVAAEVGANHATPLKGGPSNYSGKWQIDMVPGFVLTVNQQGAKVTGTFVGTLGAGQFNYSVRGHVHGDQMALKGKGTSNTSPSKFSAHVALNLPTVFSGTAVTKTNGVSSGEVSFSGVHL